MMNAHNMFDPRFHSEFVGAAGQDIRGLLGRRGWRGGRARRGQLRESILRLLSEQPLNGYQIMTGLAERTMDAWHPSPGAIYPALNQLEDEGLITTTQVEGQKVFTLTESGQAALEKIAPEPWAEPGTSPSQLQAMMEQFRNLGITIRFAAQTASPDQIQSIATQLEAARKTILAIMAEAR
jgi:DNA-binding PadR family transcriptional regulator